jgi:hypothetical protein
VTGSQESPEGGANDSGRRMPADAPRPLPAAGPLPLAPAVVLDTNAVLDWLWFDDPAMAAPAQAILAGRCRWSMSPGMRLELERVLSSKPLPPRGRDRTQVLRTCDTLARPADVASPPARLAQPGHPGRPGHRGHRLVCRDPDDQPFVDHAIGVGAAWLLTRDKALLALARRAGAFGLVIAVPARWALARPTGAP